MPTKEKRTAKQNVVKDQDNINIYTEKFPGYNLTIAAWYKLTSAGFSDDFLKCVGKLDNPEKFVKRMLHAKMSRSEIDELDHTADLIFQADVSATQLVDGFEDIMITRTKTRTLVLLELGGKYEDIIRQLIPYGLKLMPGKSGSLLELDWEGGSYFKEHTRSRNDGPASAFTNKVLRIAKKK